MDIGLTYDLRSEYLALGYSEEETAEFDREDTIELLAEAIAACGHRVHRIGRLQRLVERLASGERWPLVFNIAEGLRGTAREAQIPAVLDAYAIAYTFADPAALTLCLDKALCKLVVRGGGIPTADFVVVRRPGDLECIELAFPLFVKPLAEGTGKGISGESVVHNRAELHRLATDLLQQYAQPVLVERYLPGREFTVGLLGTGSDAVALGTLEIVLRPGAEPAVYSYKNKEYCEKLVEYRLVRACDDPQVAEAERLALAAWQIIGGRDAGRIDLRCDQRGRPQFLEANPLAGLHPCHSDLPMLATAVGMSYRELIAAIIESASVRIRQYPLAAQAQAGAR